MGRRVCIYDVSFCKAICLGCTVGSRQAEQGSRESMEEEDMVKSIGIASREEMNR